MSIVNETRGANTKVITGKDTRFSYLHVWEPKSVNGGNPRYSVSLLIPKSDTETVEAIQAAVRAAYRDGEALLRGTAKTVPPMSSLKLPLRDGDTDRPEDPAYAGCWFLNANSDRAPGVVDRACVPIRDPEQVYSGCYGRASVTFFAFNSNGNRGIACGLNNLQKMRDGEPLGGRASAESDFAPFAEEEDPDFLR